MDWSNIGSQPGAVFCGDGATAGTKKGWRFFGGSPPEMGVSENVVYPIVPNGFADHYPYEKWLFHWED